jgi:hypothetical protein
MINRVVDLLVKEEYVPEMQAREIAEGFVPNLKRWNHVRAGSSLPLAYPA